MLPDPTPALTAVLAIAGIQSMFEETLIARMVNIAWEMLIQGPPMN